MIALTLFVCVLNAAICQPEPVEIVEPLFGSVESCVSYIPFAKSDWKEIHPEMQVSGARCQERKGSLEKEYRKHINPRSDDRN